jgi:hypothetical protein
VHDGKAYDKIQILSICSILFSGLNVEPLKESDDFNCYETMILMKNDSKPLKILILDFLSWVGCGYCCCGVSFVKGKGVAYRQNEEKGLVY